GIKTNEKFLEYAFQLMVVKDRGVETANAINRQLIRPAFEKILPEDEFLRGGFGGYSRSVDSVAANVQLDRVRLKTAFTGANDGLAKLNAKSTGLIEAMKIAKILIGKNKKEVDDHELLLSCGTELRRTFAELIADEFDAIQILSEARAK